MSKKITLFGGTGFVGQHLAARLSSLGYQVQIPTRQRERHRELLVLPGVHVIQADPYDSEVLKDILSDADVVINLVGILNESRGLEHKYQTAHVELTQKILDTCVELGIDRYLHMSALKADAEKAPSEYLKSKGAAELLVNKSSVTTTTFRPSVIFGAQDSFVNQFATLLKIPSRFFFLPMPNARFSPVYVDDVVSAFVKALDDRSTFNKVYSCCGPKIYSMREIIQLMIATMGLKRKIVGLNNGMSKFAASVIGILPGKLFTKDNFLSMQVNSICEENGLGKLGITPTSMEEIIPAYLKPRDINVTLSRYRRTAGR